MNTINFTPSLTLCILLCVGSNVIAGAEKLGEKKTAEVHGNHSNSEIMDICNKTYSIKMDYLQELNDTGSFPDESEKTPACFIKCFLEHVGVLDNNSTVNKEKAVTFYELVNFDEVDNCVKDSEEILVKDDCFKAYFFARCIMQQKLLDSLGEDNDNLN